MAALILRMESQARDMRRLPTPKEIATCGQQAGVKLDPATYLLAGLQARLASQQEETQVPAVCELLAFARYPDEANDIMLVPYECARARAVS